MPRGEMEMEESLKTCQGTAREARYLKVDMGWTVWHIGVGIHHGLS